MYIQSNYLTMGTVRLAVQMDIVLCIHYSIHLTAMQISNCTHMYNLITIQVYQTVCWKDSTLHNRRNCILDDDHCNDNDSAPVIQSNPSHL